MGRPPSIPVEKKTRIVLSVLAGEMSIAEAARKEKVSEQSEPGWDRSQFCLICTRRACNGPRRR